MNKHEWRALPGNVLAYGDTGFEIRLVNDARRDPYIAFDPEGRRMPIGGTVLQYMKVRVEQEASDRAEFECSADSGSGS